MANTEWSKLWSMMFRSKNHPVSEHRAGFEPQVIFQPFAELPLAAHREQRRQQARCSGGMDARPLAAYIRSKAGESLTRA